MALVVRPKLAKLDFLPKVRDNRIVFLFSFRMPIVSSLTRKIILFPKSITIQAATLTGVMSLPSATTIPTELCGWKFYTNKLLMMFY
jgi:hypothetical protein